MQIYASLVDMAGNCNVHILISILKDLLRLSFLFLPFYKYRIYHKSAEMFDIGSERWFSKFINHLNDKHHLFLRVVSLSLCIKLVCNYLLHSTRRTSRHVNRTHRFCFGTRAKGVHIRRRRLAHFLCIYKNIYIVYSLALSI
jgi:hypothetical protein